MMVRWAVHLNVSIAAVSDGEPQTVRLSSYMLRNTVESCATFTNSCEMGGRWTATRLQ